MFNNNNNNPYGKAVKEEEELMRSISSYSQYEQQQQPFMLINPTAMDELQYDTGVTPFLTKTYELVDDQTTNQVVSWSKGNNSFVIWDPQVFSINILPRYFKHNNFSSFVRQLNTYGFRKVDVDIWEFANEDFLRGQKHLLRAIKRKKPPPYPPPPPHHQPSSQNQDRPCVEIGRFNLDQEIDRLRRDKQVLMSELVRIRQQQHHTKSYLKEMETRLQKTENKQQQMMTFLSKALQNPNFLDQMIQIEKRKDFEDALMQNKRRRPIDHHHHHHHQGQCSNNNIGFGNPGFLHENMYVLANEHNGKMVNNVGGEERLFDERFWEGVEDEIDVLRVDQSQNVGYLHEGLLAQHFGYLDPNMP